ncbi:MAG: NADH-quinone oxidoreductase subunit K [Phycisphaerae bacterium]|nr:NADH-quinone oxidoreductase subunit K [Phycisphaerae bacterium RAS2]QOJ03738.1 MAG: NADH-quinone oxidoreductase subunit NuoK [Planctomycetia bacterium]GJQ28004.1 MAG: NADH-quinone oxidoreductase subunit K [Phycisphaerae bacterium]
MLAIGLNHYLVLSALIFSLGVLCMTTKRNAIGILIGVELVLNAANINFVAFSKYQTGAGDGHIFAVFVILLAAAEAAIGIAIFMNFYNRLATIDVDRGDELKH